MAQFLWRSLRFYWRSHLAVVLGIATAVAVLSGALLVGDSVRASLRELALGRLGHTDRAVFSTAFFRDQLAADVAGDSAFTSSFADVCPLISLQGLVTDQSTGRRVSRVQVYGVDDRFWRFHGFTGVAAPKGREVWLSEALAAEIGATTGSTLLVRVDRPLDIPLESLHGRKDDRGRTIRLTVRRILGAGDLGEFSLQPRQGPVRVAYLPLDRLQRDLDLAARVNVLLISDRADRAARPAGAQDPAHQLDALVRRHTTPDDLGLTLRVVSGGAIAIEGAAGLLDGPRVKAVESALAREHLKPQPVFTYLVNRLSAGGRSIPYSLVTATDLAAIAPEMHSPPASQPPPIVLNDWAAKDLGVKVGDGIALEYYAWVDPGVLETRTSAFRLAAIVPIHGAAADPDFAPVYPGISQSEHLRDWDPPFPIDLGVVRPTDETYWKTYRTTPKAFVPFETGSALWRSRYGDRTSMRAAPKSGQTSEEARAAIVAALGADVDPLSMGMATSDVRADGLAAARGATDFGEYFTYFSFFLVASALLLAALFFKLGVEQRAREVGLLRSLGFTTRIVRRLFVGESLILAAIGGVLGTAGAVAYGWLMMTGLRTWWSGAVGTSALTLHLTATPLLAGVAGATVASLVCIWWTLRGLARVSERSLLAGQLAGDVITGTSRGRFATKARAWAVLSAVGFTALGVAAMASTLVFGLDRAAAFYAAGTAFLVAGLSVLVVRLEAPSATPLGGHGWWPVARIGFRNAAMRSGRSVLSAAVIASATFVIVSVDAFRQEGPLPTDRHSGVGGYSLLVDLLLPVAYDPNTPKGRDALGLSGATDISVEPFRVHPGDDASCLNLYQPKNPRLLGVRNSFVAANRFAFSAAVPGTPAERANPWQLLTRGLEGDVVPVIADANSMTYVLHRTLGEEVVLMHGDRPIRLRLMAALSDSLFQSELLMSEANFTRLFPEHQGYQFLLVDAPPGRVGSLAAAIDEAGADMGASAVPTTVRLGEFHRVQNTYLSTFQTLGGLGLLVGTVGLAAVVLRNVLERRRELALLGAVGYRRAHVFVMVLAENALLLVWGLVVGTICALIAIAPAAFDQGGRLPTRGSVGLLLLAVLVAGLVSSIVATSAALRAPLLESLRAE